MTESEIKKLTQVILHVDLARSMLPDLGLCAMGELEKARKCLIDLRTEEHGTVEKVATMG